MKTAFLFSGQGSQYPGMGAELAAKYPACKAVLECGSDIMGYDVPKALTESTPEELAQTRLSQPAIFTTSLLALTAVREEGVLCDAVAGHSLGEYAAMVAAGVLSFKDGFRVIKARAAAMQKAAENSKGTMCAVMGQKPEDIEKICESVNGYVVPVNYNSAVQTVIAGEPDAVDAAVSEFEKLGAKAIKLKVAAAFHSKLMQPAADEFGAELRKMDITFNKPNVKFFSNLTGAEMTDIDNMPERLAKHIVSPVLFTKELAAMQSEGFDTFVELGPGKVLTGLVRKTLSDVTALNVENAKTLEKALEALK